MKRVIITLSLLAATLVAAAQNTQEAAAEAAAALSQAEDVPVKVEKPKYWTSGIVTNLTFGQTFLSQWAAGGYNNLSLAANIDASANYEKDKLKGVNRLQLDYGFLWSADKPILQTNKDRIYFESKWGYETPVRHLSYSGSFDFRTQFYKNFDYKTPKNYAGDQPTVEEWLNARNIKSGFLSPAYINIGIGALWTPAPWFSLNFSPVSGGAVLVILKELRYTYGMDLKQEYLQDIPEHEREHVDVDAIRKSYYEAGLTDPTEYEAFKWARFELGAQIKLDMGWVINDVFSYNTQFTAFYNYLTPKVEPRITWDNKVFWKLRKWFALTLGTNLIYDPRVRVNPNREDGKGVQFREFLEVGFTYSISHKH